MYLKDGFQPSTIYYVPIILLLLFGKLYEITQVDTIILMSIVFMQYNESSIHDLPENNKLAGFRTIKTEGGE